MSKTNNIIALEIFAAVYEGNLGVEELFKFYKKATPEQEAKMEKILQTSDWKEFKKLIKKVLGVDLK